MVQEQLLVRRYNVIKLKTLHGNVSVLAERLHKGKCLVRGFPFHRENIQTFGFVERK